MKQGFQIIHSTHWRHFHFPTTENRCTKDWNWTKSGFQLPWLIGPKCVRQFEVVEIGACNRFYEKITQQHVLELNLTWAPWETDSQIETDKDYFGFSGIWKIKMRRNMLIYSMHRQNLFYLDFGYVPNLFGHFQTLW